MKDERHYKNMPLKKETLNDFDALYNAWKKRNPDKQKRDFADEVTAIGIDGMSRKLFADEEAD